MDLRSALAAKKGNETHFDLLVGDPADAEAEVRAAEGAVRLALLRGEDAESARERERAAQESLREHYFRLRFRNLPAHEFEALVGEHEASKEMAEQGEVWDRESLTPALLAACTIDSDLTTEEWRAELSSDRWSAADKLAVYRAALDANIKERSTVLPKG